MVFPGAFLYLEADSQSRAHVRRRTDGYHRVHTPGRLVGHAAVLGSGPARNEADPLGDGSGRAADRLSVGVLSAWVLPMKPLVAGLFAICLAAAAKDSCLECHSILEGNLQAPAKAFGSDIHAR